MTLKATPHNLASELALSIFSKVLDAVRADCLVHQAVQRTGDVLFIQGQHVDLSHFGQIWIAGSGKASVKMAQAAAEILGERLSGGLIVTKLGSAEPIEGVTVLEAAHPVPDQTSLDAGARMLEFAEGLDEKDFVLYLLSGGSSALMESLVEAATFEQLQEMNARLLASGTDIGQINSARSSLSRIKAGGLARVFAPATVVVLVLSDVVGNDLRTIGSGPFISPSTKSAGPGLLAIPTAFRTILDPFEFEPVQHFVIGSISLAIHAAVDAARFLGLTPLPFADPLKGEARTMARTICRHAAEHLREEICMIFGGETTVKIRGKGLGGRCQEMALAAARPISSMKDVCFLACGTDGTDGPTAAVGGMIDPESLSRAKARGFSDAKSLQANDSYHFLEACGGLIVTGPTGSNVNDLVLVVSAIR